MKYVPGVDMSTGSLGQGISTAVGMALAGKQSGKNYRVYSILGDGEVAEGQVWEAMMAASKYHLDNLCACVDVNGLHDKLGIFFRQSCELFAVCLTSSDLFTRAARGSRCATLSPIRI